MAGGYSVGIASETKAFKQGFDSGVIDPIQDAQQELTELGRNRGPDQLEQSLKDAQRETEQLKAETKQTADAIEREYRQSYRNVRNSASDAADSAEKSQHRISEKSQEVGEEVRQNLGEGIANAARGDFSQLADTIGDTLGGITAGIGGIGTAAIGVAGAVGLGAILGAIQQQQEAAQVLKQRLADAYQSAASEGRDYLDVSQLIANGQDLMFNPDRANEWKQVQKDAIKLGLDNATLVKANAGDLTAQAVVMKRINELQAEQDDKVNGSSKIAGKVHDAQKKDLDDLASRWQNVADETDKQAAAAANSKQITSDMLLDAVKKAGSASVEVDKLGNQIVHLPDKDVFIDAKTGRATEDLSRFKGDLDHKVPTVKTTKILADADAAYRTLNSLRREASKPIRVSITGEYAIKGNPSRRMV